MSAVVCLAHFCEQHGPRVVFCTQTCSLDTLLNLHRSSGVWEDELSDNTSVASSSSSVTSSRAGGGGSSANRTNNSTTSTQRRSRLSSSATNATSTSVQQPPSAQNKCASCSSLPGSSCFVSVDDESGTYVVSTARPERHMYSRLQEVCLRSLTHELCPGMEGPIMFGDEERGYVLSYLFKIVDSKARGHCRMYSFIVSLEDCHILTSSWDFLTVTLCQLVSDLQSRANRVFAKECNSQSSPADYRNATSAPPSRSRLLHRRQTGVHVAQRSLAELVGVPNLFRDLHARLSWLLRGSAIRVSEKRARGLGDSTFLIAFSGFNDGTSHASAQIDKLLAFKRRQLESTEGSEGQYYEDNYDEEGDYDGESSPATPVVPTAAGGGGGGATGRGGRGGRGGGGGGRGGSSGRRSNKGKASRDDDASEELSADEGGRPPQVVTATTTGQTGGGRGSGGGGGGGESRSHPTSPLVGLRRDKSGGSWPGGRRASGGDGDADEYGYDGYEYDGSAEEGEGGANGPVRPRQPTASNVRLRVHSLAELYSVIGPDRFAAVVYQSVIGNQVVVRGDDQAMVDSVAELIGTILPEGCVSIVTGANEYLDRWRCNILGATQAARIPAYVKSGTYVLIDITSVGEREAKAKSSVPTLHSHYRFVVVGDAAETTYGTAVVHLCGQDGLAESTRLMRLEQLKELWLNNAKAFFRFAKVHGLENKFYVDTFVKAFKLLKGDLEMLKFWMSGLDPAIRCRALAAASHQTSMSVAG